MKNADRPAFPIQARRSDESAIPGLTKREVAAMSQWTREELMSVAQQIVDETNVEGRHFENYVSRDDPEVLAKARVRLADALLAELENTEES